MKAGLLFILWVLRWLQHSGLEHPQLEVLLTPDEEVGAVASAPVITAAARRADFALITEPTITDGSLKVARKGSGEYRLTVSGRTAHQGVEPELGANAVVEAARQILRLKEIERPEIGTTVGPNVVRGGTVSNAVPDRCEVRIDVRAWSAAETARVDAELTALRPHDPATTLRLEGGWNRPPMEPTAASMELFERARTIARAHGLTIGSVRWGGSSDANLTAAAGTPTVDGFGPVGAGSHHPDEHVLVSELALRMALLADLVASLAMPPQHWLSPAAVADRSGTTPSHQPAHEGGSRA
jgi:glutamate carboxypeptidase